MVIFYFFQKLNYHDLEELSHDVVILENILDTPNVTETIFPPVVKTVIKTSQIWGSKLPPMLFTPPRLEFICEEVFIFFVFCIFLFCFKYCFFRLFISFFFSRPPTLSTTSPL